MKRISNKLFKNAFSTFLTVVVATLVITTAVVAATTVGTNFSTDGTLTVTGLSTFDKATSTSATTTDYLYIGPDGTENYFDFQGGDLYVADDAEIDGALYVTGASTLTGALAANGGITVDSTAFTVADTSGNVSTTGTLSVTGTSALTGATTVTGALYADGGLDRSTAAALAIGATNATSVAITPNTAITGTLGVTGASTLTGALVANGDVTLGDAAADTLTVNAGLVYGAKTITTGIDLGAATLTTGIDLGDNSSTGIDVGNATTGIALTGAQTTGIAVTGTLTTGIDLGDTLTTGLDIGTATNRLVFSGVTGGTATNGSLIKAGTAAAKMSSATADHKFLALYLENTATSGDNRGIYNRLYLSGAGGGGESLRSYTEIVGVAAGTAHGAHISLGMGESTTGGAVTGLGAGVRATLGLPDVALAAGGTYTPLMAEIYSFGDNSDAGAVTELSFLRVVNDGTTNGKNTVDDDAFLLSLQGFTAGAGHVFDSTVSTVGAQIDHTLKIKIGSTTYYIPLMDNADGS